MPVPLESIGTQVAVLVPMVWVSPSMEFGRTSSADSTSKSRTVSVARSLAGGTLPRCGVKNLPANTRAVGLVLALVLVSTSLLG